MRIVSLLPAATEMVAALGGQLVGVSHECDFPPSVRSLPRVTRSTLDPSLSSRAIDRVMADAKRRGGTGAAVGAVGAVEVDARLVAQLRPDVLIGQAVCDVCAVGEGELAQLVTNLIPIPWVVTLHAHTLAGVFADIRKVGEALELRDEADELVAGLRYRLRRVEDRTHDRGNVGAQHAASLRRPRVLVLEWLDPPYVAGHWVPELVTLAGGENVGALAGEPSRPRPWGELAALNPDLVVVAPCGFDVPRARAELASLTDGDARALLARRVEVIDGNAYTSRPGPRLVDAAELLSQLMLR